MVSEKETKENVLQSEKFKSKVCHFSIFFFDITLESLEWALTTVKF